MGKTEEEKLFKQERKLRKQCEKEKARELKKKLKLDKMKEKEDRKRAKVQAKLNQILGREIELECCAPGPKCERLDQVRKKREQGDQLRCEFDNLKKQMTNTCSEKLQDQENLHGTQDACMDPCDDTGDPCVDPCDPCVDPCDPCVEPCVNDLRSPLQSSTVESLRVRRRLRKAQERVRKRVCDDSCDPKNGVGPGTNGYARGMRLFRRGRTRDDSTSSTTSSTTSSSNCSTCNEDNGRRRRGRFKSPCAPTTGRKPSSCRPNKRSGTNWNC